MLPQRGQVVVVVAAAFLVGGAHTTAGALPPGSRRLPPSLGITNSTAWELSGDNVYVTRETITDDTGDRAVRLVTLALDGHAAPPVWHAVLDAYIPFGVNLGDTGLLTFTARASPTALWGTALPLASRPSPEGSERSGTVGKAGGVAPSNPTITLIVPVVQSDLDKSYTKSVDVVGSPG